MGKKELKKGAETRCKDKAMALISTIGEEGMRYYPAFDVKSGRDARFRRFLKA
ncbi:MAG: hypothetical protein V4646_14290 [Pseudomonadota bacterium]